MPGPDDAPAAGALALDDAAGRPPVPRRVTSFRTRRTTLTESQQQSWDRAWPRRGVVARDGDRQTGLLDTAAWFGRRAPVVLEIGCGTGTSTAAMAQAEPDLDVIAVEVYKRGLAQLLGTVEREAIDNVRLVRGDGLDVLEHMVASRSLTAVRVFFPDPWPKSRHHKRRLLQPATVALIADRLVPGGVLHAATDHAGYAEHIADVGDAEPALVRAEAGASLPVSVRRPTTKYEGKAQSVGSAVTELVWVTRSDAPGGRP